MTERWLIPLLILTVAVAVHAGDFNYTTNDGTITITGYTGPGGDVAIPDTITGLPVTSIGDWAFFEGLFAQTVQQCVQAGLVQGRLLHIDSTMVKAHASKDSVVAGGPELVRALRQAYQEQAAKLQVLSRDDEEPSASAPATPAAVEPPAGPEAVFRRPPASRSPVLPPPRRLKSSPRRHRRKSPSRPSPPARSFPSRARAGGGVGGGAGAGQQSGGAAEPPPPAARDGGQLCRCGQQPRGQEGPVAGVVAAKDPELADCGGAKPAGAVAPPSPWTDPGRGRRPGWSCRPEPDLEGGGSVRAVPEALGRELGRGRRSESDHGPSGCNTAYGRYEGEPTRSGKKGTWATRPYVGSYFFNGLLDLAEGLGKSAPLAGCGLPAAAETQGAAGLLR